MLHNLEFFFLQNTGKQAIITIDPSSLLWNSDLQIWKRDAGIYLSKKLVSGLEEFQSEVKTVSFSNFTLSVRALKIKSSKSHPSLQIHTKLTPRNELKVLQMHVLDQEGQEAIWLQVLL